MADSSCWQLLRVAVAWEGSYLWLWIFCTEWYRLTHRPDSVCTLESGVISGKAISAGCKMPRLDGVRLKFFQLFPQQEGDSLRNIRRDSRWWSYQNSLFLIGTINPILWPLVKGCMPYLGGDKRVTLLGPCGDGTSRSPNANPREDYQPRRASKYLLLMQWQEPVLVWLGKRRFLRQLDRCDL